VPRDHVHIAAGPPPRSDFHAAQAQLENPVATASVPTPRPRRLRLRAILAALIVSLLVGGTVAGCSSGAGSTMSAPAAAESQATAAAGQGGGAATVPMGDMHMPTADEVSGTWSARPGYVKALPAEGQAAYAFALARPDVLQWMPCYCGCAGIPHRSNLDCFFVRREVKGTYTYEEHASFCDICIKTANMASGMLQQGKTMTQIRAAVDSTFGGGAAPGTDTALPPAS
jgi:hypothetical protein